MDMSPERDQSSVQVGREATSGTKSCARCKVEAQLHVLGTE